MYGGHFCEKNSGAQMGRFTTKADSPEACRSRDDVINNRPSLFSRKYAVFRTNSAFIQVFEGADHDGLTPRSRKCPYDHGSRVMEPQDTRGKIEKIHC